MKSYLLLLLLSISIFQLNAQIKETEPELMEIEEEPVLMEVEPEFVEMDVEMPPEETDNRSYEQLPSIPFELADLRAKDVLPNTQLTEVNYATTNRIDTFQFQYKWFYEGVDSTEVFAFTTKDNPHTDYRFAIKRKADWLFVKARTIDNLNMKHANCKKIKFANHEDELLLITISTPGDKQVRSKSGIGVDSQFKQARAVSLLNINTTEYYLHNVMMGYIYNFNTENEVNGIKIKNNKKQEVQYDYAFDKQNATLKITKLENHITTEIIDVKNGNSKDVQQDVCRPILKTGSYQLEGNRFILMK